MLHVLYTVLMACGLLLACGAGGVILVYGSMLAVMAVFLFCMGIVRCVEFIFSCLVWLISCLVVAVAINPVLYMRDRPRWKLPQWFFLQLVD